MLHVMHHADKLELRKEALRHPFHVELLMCVVTMSLLMMKQRYLRTYSMVT